MTDFTRQNLSGSTFKEVHLTDAQFRDVDLTNARFHSVDLTGATVSDALLIDLDLSGEISKLRVNGVDVVPLVEAELDRRYPDRAKMRPENADGFREAWDILERLWQGTVERARRMPPQQLHERVNGEWSFIETLRHLVFATDKWVKRTILGDPSPWDPSELSGDEIPADFGVPSDLLEDDDGTGRRVRPSLDEALARRRDRMTTVRQVIADLTDETLAVMTEPVVLPGYREPKSFPIRKCLQTILNEEWEHRLYAERDLDLLDSRSS